MQNNSDEFPVSGRTDLPTSNLLEKGRYQFEVKDIESFTSKNNNFCIKVKLNVSGRKIRDCMVLLDLDGNPAPMSWKWRQFLFSVGIRENRDKFTVKKERIIGSKGLVDVGVKDSEYDDGTVLRENVVRSYSPIQEETAPIKGVEPENTTEKEKPKKEKVDKKEDKTPDKEDKTPFEKMPEEDENEGL